MPTSHSHSGPKRIALNGRAPSKRLLRACCRFGIGVTRDTSPVHMPIELEALLALGPGSAALITGASGSGKSRLLKRLRDEVRGPKVCDLSSIYRRGRRSVIDLIPLPLDQALRLLAASGLADPFVLGRTVCELSVGERSRFLLARALAKQRRAGWLLIDEFLTTLDRETASGVARSFRRAAREFAPELRVVVATAHADLAPEFGADVWMRL